MTGRVDTSKVADYRQLRFDAIEDCLAEIDRIVEADGLGHVRCTGNWTAGQIFNHVAAWIEYGYTGYPIKSPPFFIRWLLRWKLKGILQGQQMPRGVKIPRIPQGTTGMDDGPTAIAAERLKRAWRRLQLGEPAPYDSPAFGPMSQADRILLNLRHAELHLGFLRLD